METVLQQVLFLKKALCRRANPPNIVRKIPYSR